MENCSVSKRAVTYAIANLRRVGALKVLKPGRWRQRAEYQLVPAENWKPIARNRLRTTGPVARKKRHLQGAKNDTHSTQPVACLTIEGTTEATTPPVQTSPPPPSASLTSPKKSKAPASSIESQPVARAYAREGQRQEEEEEEKDLQGNVNDEVNDDGGGGGGRSWGRRQRQRRHPGDQRAAAEPAPAPSAELHRDPRPAAARAGGDRWRPVLAVPAVALGRGGGRARRQLGERFFRRQSPGGVRRACTAGSTREGTTPPNPRRRTATAARRPERRRTDEL